MFCNGIPMFKPSMMLHAEQKTEFVNKAYADQKIEQTMEIIEVSDKGPKVGCLVTLKFHSY